MHPRAMIFISGYTDIIYQERRGTTMEQVFAGGDAPAVVVQGDAPSVTGGAEAQLSASDAGLYARFFRVLSYPTRVRLLHLLFEAPQAGRTVRSLVAAVGAPQERISPHLG